MTDTVSSYDQVPYLFTSFRESHPRLLQATAYLLGLETPAPAQCRVLELGCAVGGNIVPMAYSLPGAQLIGIDLVASQIETAKKFAAASGVRNLELRAVSIADVTPEWGKFDYIIAHGVFSWVPHEVAEKVLQICAGQLAPNGVAYISFNTYPGWHMRMWAREAMQFHAERIPDRFQAARAARDFIVALAQSPFNLSPLLQREVQYLQGQPENYLLHEYFENSNHPFYFRDFATRIAGYGLQYLGDAMQNSMVTERGAAPLERWQQADRDELIRQEQYTDFVRNREFRRALLCHGNLTIDRTQMLARVERMQAATLLQLSAEANGMSRLQHSRGARLVTGDVALRDALMTISRRFPQAISVAEASGAVAGQQRASLLHGLLNCWLTGMVELYLDPPPVLAHPPGEKPRVNAVARYLAAQNQAPINQRHGTIQVDAIQRRFLQLVDGTRTREQLARELRTDRANVDRLLQFLMSAALLEA